MAVPLSVLDSRTSIRKSRPAGATNGDEVNEMVSPLMAGGKEFSRLKTLIYDCQRAKAECRYNRLSNFTGEGALTENFFHPGRLQGRILIWNYISMKKIYPYAICSAIEIATGFLLFDKSDMMFPLHIIHPAVGIIIILSGLQRMAVAAELYWQKRNLRQISPLRLTKIPEKKDSVYIGRGFHWLNKHTQFLYNITRKMDISNLLSRNQDMGGISLIHGVNNDGEKNIYIPLSELTGHLMIAGTTRAGKTRLMEILCAQAIRRQDAVIVIDPKGDFDLLNRCYEESIKSSRKDDFIFFALPYPGISVTYNPLENFVAETDIADRVVSLLPSHGESEAFRQFSWRVINSVTIALLSCGRKPTLDDLKYFSFLNMEELIRLCKNNPGAENLLALHRHPKEHFAKITASLSPLLEKLTSGEKKDLLSTIPAKLNWSKALNGRKIIYFFLGSLIGEDTANAVGRMALSDLTSFIGSRYAYSKQRNPISLFIDESHNVIYDGIINIVNKAGGAGLRLTFAMQSIADLEANLSNPAIAQQILDNINTRIFFRATDFNTAKNFSDKTGKTIVRSISEMAMINPLNDGLINFNASYRRGVMDKEVNLIEPSWINALPKGQAFMYLQGKPYKLRLPLLPDVKKDYLLEHGIFPELKPGREKSSKEKTLGEIRKNLVIR